MAIRWLATVILSGGLAGCNPQTPSHDFNARRDEIMRRNENSMDKVEEEGVRFEAQLKRSDEQQDKMDEQNKRFDKILQKQEEQAARLDAILDHQEKELGIKRKP